MSLPHVENNAALPALFERMRTRAPDGLYPDTLTATGFDSSEYANINGLLYHLKFYLPAGLDEQHVSAFWKERYYRADDHRKALGWMLKKQYAFIFERAANPLKPTQAEVIAAIENTRYIDEHQRADTDKIAATFMALHEIADTNVTDDYFGAWPDWYVISGEMPRDNSPPTLRSLIPPLQPVWWLVIALGLAFLVVRCQA